MKQKEENILARLSYFLHPFDKRYEDLFKGNIAGNVVKDLTAGLIVAMIAIPMAMGFAMASGLRPEQGIVGGAVAGLIGALFGGSKYQVYGPTAAYIPIIGALMATYNHGFLVLASSIAGILLMISGVAKLGKIIAKVPNSIVVGFTAGIAVVIAFSQMGEVLGYKSKLGYGLSEQIENIFKFKSEFNIYAVIIAILTFILCRVAKKVSPFLPGPLLGLAVGFIAAKTFWADNGLVLIKDKFGSIPTDFFVFTMPLLPESWTGQVIFDLIYFVVAIYFIAAVESLLCSRMADRLANNKGMPFNPDKEFWGQGMVNIITPLFNGFPHTGALARTAVNIKLGALSPLAGIAKFTFKLLLAAFLAVYLESVPMACIGGILLYVATNMVKMEELSEIFHMKSNIHLMLMIYTAIMLPFFGFLMAVLSAIGLYIVFNYMGDHHLIRKLDEADHISRAYGFIKGRKNKMEKYD